MSAPLFEIRDLHVAVEGKEVLKGVNLVVRRGEVHAIMSSKPGQSAFRGVFATFGGQPQNPSTRLPQTAAAGFGLPKPRRRTTGHVTMTRIRSRR